jgi:hypothetical protein
LSPNHRDTLRQIRQHPTSHNVEWSRVLPLLEQVGNVEHRHDGNYVVHLGEATIVLERPKHKDLATDEVVRLRRLLEDAGYGEAAAGE